MSKHELKDETKGNLLEFDRMLLTGAFQVQARQMIAQMVSNQTPKYLENQHN